jgi:hypothetical protein
MIMENEGAGVAALLKQVPLNPDLVTFRAFFQRLQGRR